MLTSAETIGTNAWHFICGYYDGTTMYTSIDGVPGVNTTPASMTIGTTAINVRIGAFVAEGVGGYFDGLLEDIRVYDRALSTAEMQAIYNSSE